MGMKTFYEIHFEKNKKTHIFKEDKEISWKEFQKISFHLTVDCLILGEDKAIINLIGN